MYLVDTSVVSALRASSRRPVDARLLAWSRSVDRHLLHLSVLSLLELDIGVRRLARRDTAAADVVNTWLHQNVVPTFAGRTHDVTAVVVERAAPLHVPDPAPAIDALIAATALVHGMGVVTRNVADFSRFDDLEVLNPWDWDG